MGEKIPKSESLEVENSVSEKGKIEPAVCMVESLKVKTSAEIDSLFKIWQAGEKICGKKIKDQ